MLGIESRGYSSESLELVLLERTDVGFQSFVRFCRFCYTGGIKGGTFIQEYSNILSSFKEKTDFMSAQKIYN